MKVSIFGFLFVALFVFTACDKHEMSEAMMQDQILIESIRDAQKQTVTAADLPTVAAAVLSTEFVESSLNAVKLATALGYQVTMGESETAGFEVYFDLNGKPLKSREGGKKCNSKGRKGKKGEQKSETKPCFKMTGTVSFTMPDGSLVSGENREAIGDAVKAWYEANPGTKERPALNFPVTVVFADGNEVVLNSMEDLKDAKGVCGDKVSEEDN